MKTFEEAKQVLRDIRDENRAAYIRLRQIAAERLSEDWPEGEGMGSSDVSCAAIEIVRTEDWEALVFETARDFFSRRWREAGFMSCYETSERYEMSVSDCIDQFTEMKQVQ